MAKPTNKTAVNNNLPATVESITQNDLPAMLKIIDGKISQLKGDDKGDEVITVELPGFGRVSEIKDTMLLRLAYMTVSKKAQSVNECNEVFKAVAPTINVPLYKEAGHSPEQWMKVILSQYKKVVFKEELDKLVKAKEKIQANLSQEEKMKADLVDVFGLLNIAEG